jgi:hypothetical protein
MSPARAIYQEREAVNRLSSELRELFIRAFGKDPDPEIVREEAKNLVSRHGVTAELRDIFDA